MQIEVAGSKSIMIRILLIAGLGETPIRIENPADCADTQELLDALQTLGAHYRFVDGCLEIKPVKEVPTGLIAMHFEGSATALRLMIARLAVMDGVHAAIGLSHELARRPHGELFDALPGVTFDRSSATIEIHGCRIKRLHLTTKGNVSSQYISAMMLAAPFTEDGFDMRIPEDQVSRPYLDITAGVMRDFGVDVSIEDGVIDVPGGQEYVYPKRYEIEPDASTAAFWLVASLITGREVVVRYPKCDSRQGDARFLDVLKGMGVNFRRWERGVSVNVDRLRGIDVDMRDMPDCVPALVSLALHADSATRIAGIGHLRWKESDRIERIVTQVRRIGGMIEYSAETLVVSPLSKPPRPVVIETGSDHRIAMMFAALALRYPSIEIDDRMCVRKSCGNFWDNVQIISS